MAQIGLLTAASLALVGCTLEPQFGEVGSLRRREPDPMGSAAPTGMAALDATQSPKQATGATASESTAAPSGSAPAAPSGAEPTGAPPRGDFDGPRLPPPPPRPVVPGDVRSCEDRVVSRSRPCSDDPDPCGLNSGWPGDEYCLRPPAEGEGIQIHFGPKSYSDPAEYVLQPGAEFNNSVLAHIPLTGSRWFYRITAQMRPGIHHWLSTVVQGRPREGFYNSTSCDDVAINGAGFGGGQTLIYDNPPLGIPAPENDGLGRQILGNGSACLNVHAYNLSDTPSLREIWVNVYFIDEAKLTQMTGSIALLGGLGLNLPPGQSRTLSYQARFTAEGRILQLFGHRHVWTPRFTAHLNDELVYDSRDWEESVVYNYDSLTMNPPLDPAGATDGAVSGMLPFQAGDVLRFSCFVENQSDRVLRFGNQLVDGEMCNLWGITVGGSLSGWYQ